MSLSLGSLGRRGRRGARFALYRALSVGYRLRKAAGDAVLLTFDDGPHPEVTPAVLDRLRRYSSLAVFFVVGNRIPRAPWALAAITADGHVIGNHSYYHDYKKRGAADYAEDIRLCQQEVQELTGSRPSLFRPPLGRVTAGGLRAARRHGLKTLCWSVDGGDWALRTREAARECGERLSQDIGPGDVVLLHDDNPCVLTVLDVLLPRLAAHGFDLGGVAAAFRRAPAAQNFVPYL